MTFTGCRLQSETQIAVEDLPLMSLLSAVRLVELIRLTMHTHMLKFYYAGVPVFN